MVDFTKPINNQDMVDALNHLIRKNQEVKAGYDEALDKLTDSSRREKLTALRDMHERHGQKLGESTRALGGSPTEDESGPGLATKAKTALGGMGSGDGVLSAMLSNEDKLNQDYRETIDQYRASGEIVEVINQIVDDSRDLRNWLEQEAGTAS